MKIQHCRKHKSKQQQTTWHISNSHKTCSRHEVNNRASGLLSYKKSTQEFLRTQKACAWSQTLAAATSSQELIILNNVRVTRFFYFLIISFDRFVQAVIPEVC